MNNNLRKINVTGITNFGKYKCMCGCDRVYNKIELDRMGIKPRDKIKCRRKMIKCNFCECLSNVLMYVYYKSVYSVNNSDNNNNTINRDLHNKAKYICFCCVKKSYQLHIAIDRDVKSRIKKLQLTIDSHENKKKISKVIENYYHSLSPREIKKLITNGTIVMDTLSEKYKTSIEAFLDIHTNKNMNYTYAKRNIYPLKNETQITNITSVNNILTNINIIWIHMKKLDIPKGIIHQIICLTMTTEEIKLSPRYKLKYL